MNADSLQRSSPCHTSYPFELRRMSGNRAAARHTTHTISDLEMAPVHQFNNEIRPPVNGLDGPDTVSDTSGTERQLLN